MSDAFDRGFTVTEDAPMGQPIDATPETTAAFIGRALRGPLDMPVLVHDFREFRRRFGDIWSRSSLGPAVRQFFEHGGRKLYIVRVANDARGALIRLPSNGSELVLRALEPGSTECIRAAVDYDGIDVDNDELFNITLQRIDPESGLVMDQELYQSVSRVTAAAAFVGDALLSSSMVRIARPFPPHRPEATTPSPARPDSGYVQAVEQGTDGKELTDYDLIGSRTEHRGLFALDQVDHFDLLYLPPPGKGRDVGPAAVLAAERYCRSRGAMLITDPGATWETPDEVVRIVRRRGYASPNIITYFPRLVSRDDRGGLPRAAGGALAGVLCKLDRIFGPWAEADQYGLGFSRHFRPSYEVPEDEAQLLMREGINVIAPGPAGRARLRGSVTMARGSEMQREPASLPVRRTCLKIITSIERAARRALFENAGESLARQLQSQVYAYLRTLASHGAFCSDRVSAQCNVELCKNGDAADRGLSILVCFHAHGCTRPLSFTLHQSAAGFRVANTAFAPVIGDCA